MNADASLYAARLFPLAQQTLVAIPAHKHEPLLAALDAFIAQPAASTFLSTWRILQSALRSRAWQRFNRRKDVADLPQALAVLQTVPHMPARIPQDLSALEADGTAAARIRALAALMGTRAELKARVDAAAERRAAQLESIKTPSAKRPKPQRPGVVSR
jgi:hypothetical protein